ncbi:MAG: helix-turn-helix domain-containing protein [Planctomycetaceae bacterium]|nr:helix-turn-helix domain-containing protein [Planctomycetaceae bacterium]
MSQMPQVVRTAIAQNIRRHRLEKFPGRGGAKSCAKAFGVSPQQWSPWERGYRTPSEAHLQRLAEFFDTTVEELTRPSLTEEAVTLPFPGQKEPLFKAIISHKVSDSSPTPVTLPEFFLDAPNAGAKAVFVIKDEMVVTEVRYETTAR